MTIIMKMKCSGRGSRSLCKERRMEEEGDIYDGVRAQFPLSFGKQSKPQTPLEAIHNATRRSNSNPKTANDLPSVSSSSRDWLNSLRPPKTPTPPPPLPPPDHDDGPMVGPPPPPPTAADEEEDDDDAEMIGPPPPPPIASESEDDSDQDEVGTRFRIPLSNEIVLKGHTKVFPSILSLSLSLNCRIEQKEQ